MMEMIMTPGWFGIACLFSTIDPTVTWWYRIRYTALGILLSPFIMLNLIIHILFGYA